SVAVLIGILCTDWNANLVKGEGGMMRQVKSTYSTRDWSVFAVLLAALVPASALAHPGSGIVVDRLGQVYFVDTGSGLWKIDTNGTIVLISAPRFYWLTIDEDERLANTRLPSGSA